MRSALCLFIVIIALLGSVQSAESVQSGNEVSENSDKNAEVSVLLDDPAVLSLVDEFGISREQAAAQMEAQFAAGDAEAGLPQGLRDVFAGRSIHHDKGGMVEIGVTDPAMAEQVETHFAEHGVEDRKVSLFDYSQDEIDKMIDEKRRNLDRKKGRKKKRKDGERGKGALTISQKELGKISIDTSPQS